MIDAAEELGTRQLNKNHNHEHKQAVLHYRVCGHNLMRRPGPPRLYPLLSEASALRARGRQGRGRVFPDENYRKELKGGPK